jgi:RsiW-degrading membrane proteinase PrsW (M82 family)
VVKLANDPERTRRTVGTVLYIVAMVAGALLFLGVFVIAPLVELNDPASYFGAMLMGAVMAIPALAAYIWIPRVVDRYDPEPWWLLLGALGWGGIASCGFAAVINTAVGEVGEALFGDGAGEIIAACVSAPIVEEGFKGLGVFGIFYFCRREFDGVVDGVIYAMFTALGFAAVEDVIYYGRAVQMELAHGAGGALGITFLLRGIVSPWGHPLFTSMTGIGFGLARESDKAHVRFLAPLGGYAAAVFLHCMWNTAGTIHAALVLIMLPLWIAAVVGFMFLVTWLVKRKGKIIRAFLQDEVLMGFITPWELDLVSSRTPRVRANALYGGEAGKRFVDTASRLALSKWHAQRASRARQKTVSADMVVPLRQELAQIRGQIAQNLRRPIEQPQPFQPGGPPPPWMRPIPQWVYRR